MARVLILAVALAAAAAGMLASLAGIAGPGAESAVAINAGIDGEIDGQAALRACVAALCGFVIF